VYQSLLTLKYLTHKVMPLLAALAVMLCTAMVLIVWSVMGGFLTMFLQSGKTLIGDVSITYPNAGFAYYADLVDRLEKDPRVAAAAPIIESFGLLQLPKSGAPENILLWGVDGPSLSKVVGYEDSLWWRPLDKPLTTDTKRSDPRLDPTWHKQLAAHLEQGKTLTVPRDPDGKETRAGLVLGVMVGGYNERLPGGVLDPYLFLPGYKATLSVAPLDSKGQSLTLQSRIVPIANQFQTGLYDLDDKLTMIRLDELQKMLYMDEAEKIQRDSAGNIITERDPATGQERPVMVRTPARVTTVLVKAKPGVNEKDLQARVREIYAQFSAAHRGEVSQPPAAEDRLLRIQTWKDRNRTMIGAIEKEIALTLVLFMIISLTAVFLVLAIFWAMVSEKTKDIGVLRAIGASRRGVAGLWLSYGLAIGIVGATLGGLAAILIVTNINPIHEWLGRQFGMVVWDPAVYYFTTIPNRIDPLRATIVLVGGLLSSVFGALVPALKAAYMDPVRSLRFE
jgi:lipoprotein-releasing system permease protein